MSDAMCCSTVANTSEMLFTGSLNAIVSGATPSAFG